MHLHAAINPSYFHPAQTLNITVGNLETDESPNDLDLKHSTTWADIIVLSVCERKNNANSIFSFPCSKILNLFKLLLRQSAFKICTVIKVIVEIFWRRTLRKGKKQYLICRIWLNELNLFWKTKFNFDWINEQTETRLVLIDYVLNLI